MPISKNDQNKQLVKNRLALEKELMPETILTARPADMDYEKYRRLRKEQKKVIKFLYNNNAPMYTQLTASKEDKYRASMANAKTNRSNNKRYANANLQAHKKSMFGSNK